MGTRECVDAHERPILWELSEHAVGLDLSRIARISLAAALAAAACGDGGGGTSADGADAAADAGKHAGSDASSAAGEGADAGRADPGGPGSDGSAPVGTGDAGPSAGTDGGAPALAGKVVGTLVPASSSAYIEALCMYYERCDPGFVPGLSLDECRLVLSQPCMQTNLEVIPDDAGGDACADVLRGLQCDQPRDALLGAPACAAALSKFYAGIVGVPALPKVGQGCGHELFCDFGNDCVGEAASATGCGQCAPLADLGGACEPGQCRTGACVGGRCVAPGKEGEACVIEQDVDGTRDYCADGLSCNGSGRCVKPGGTGASCKDSGDCDGDAQCVSGKCAYRLAAGAACKADDQCASYSCFEGRCAVIIQCAPAGLDAPCYGRAGGDCQAGLFCVDHHCVREAPADCSLEGCNEATYCDRSQTPARCVAKHMLGDPCSEYDSCAQGVCDYTTDKCQPGGSQDSCKVAADCQSGACRDGLCTAALTCSS